MKIDRSSKGLQSNSCSRSVARRTMSSTR